MKPLRNLALIVVLAGLAMLSLAHRGATNPEALAQALKTTPLPNPASLLICRFPPATTALMWRTR